MLGHQLRLPVFSTRSHANHHRSMGATVPAGSLNHVFPKKKMAARNFLFQKNQNQPENRFCIHQQHLAKWTKRAFVIIFPESVHKL